MDIDIVQVPPTNVYFNYPWVASLCGVCGNWFAKARDLEAHFADVHPGVRLRFRCERCGGARDTFRSVAIHYGKCTGPRPVGDHACTICDRRYESAVGLTQHKRHAHPDVRNAERLAPVAPRAPQASRRGLWSPEEDAVLMAGYLEVHGRPNYSIILAGRLPGKSDVQVRSRIRVLKNNGTLLEPVEGPGRDVIGDGDDEQGMGGVDPVPVVVDPIGSPVAGPSGLQPPSPVRDPVPSSIAASPEGIPGLDFTIMEFSPGQLASQEPSPEFVLPVGRASPDPADGELLAHVLSPGLSFDAASDGAGGVRVWDTVLDHIRALAPLCPIGERLRALAEREGDIELELTLLVDELQKEIREAIPARQPNPRRGGGARHRAERTRRRVARFARTQELFRKDPSRLASLVIGGDLGDLEGEDRRVSPPVNATREMYERLWGSVGPCTLTLPPLVEVAEDVEVRPFSGEEILRQVRGLKPGSAPGLDGVVKAGLVGRPSLAGTLAVLYNIVLFRGVFPGSWLANRTTLIPKPGKDLSLPESWRPITIAPLLARVYSRLLEKRLLRFVRVSDRQKGFMPGHGCMANCAILDELIRRGKRSSLVGAQLDVSKAFDTVSHEAIDRVLLARGVPSVLREAIGRSYQGGTTVLGSLGVSVGLRRGVKQGDPLSPLLFNLVLDPLLDILQGSGLGFGAGDGVLAATAYADDLTLFSATVQGMTQMLELVSGYLGSVGMSLSVPKCVTFWVERLGRAWVAKDPGLSMYGHGLRSLLPSETFRYLGVDFTLARGFSNREALAALDGASKRVAGLSLKPQQKVRLMLQYIVPSFAHRLTIDPPSLNDLRGADTSLRCWARKVLHMVPCTTDGLFYARKRDGGLGFPNLATQLRVSALKVGVSLLSSEDPVLRHLRVDAGWEGRLRSYAEQLNIAFPPTSVDIDSFKCRAKAAAHRDWARLLWQGQGVEHFRDDRIGNSWLLDFQVLPPGLFIDALKLRTNTWGSRVAIARAERGAVQECRRCRAAPETLGHIIGQCVAGRQPRIERHNAVVRRVEEACLGRGMVVAREQEFFTNEQVRLRPDLVIKSGDRVYVADVTVCYENSWSLQQAALAKVEKYAPLLPVVRRQFGATMGEVIPVVLGSRGALPRATRTGLAKLAVDSVAELRRLSLLALRSSIDIARQHMDYGGDRGRARVRTPNERGLHPEAWAGRRGRGRGPHHVL